MYTSIAIQYGVKLSSGSVLSHASLNKAYTTDFSLNFCLKFVGIIIVKNKIKRFGTQIFWACNPWMQNDLSEASLASRFLDFYFSFYHFWLNLYSAFLTKNQKCGGDKILTFLPYYHGNQEGIVLTVEETCWLYPE